ncbi:homoserine O-acetyltransferase [Roseivirga sp. BDSF3-8]|uniref:homoserine O-acetyltransferase family protein n=1 Tax=Roseivirga sp. BDSF3-8 TaxID=3241598 RepID=UPI0035323E44
MISLEAHTYTNKDGIVLESGRKLSEFQLRYHTWGNINEKRDNIVWICHALTAGSDVSLWWPDLVGSGKLFDPETHFIICANMLGGCYGSTGPLSPKPENGNPYFHNFPTLTNRDIVAAFDKLRDHLNIRQIHTLVGGSLGGQQAMEWSIVQPNLPQRLVLLATNARHSPWGIAFNESQRMAIEQDITWQLNTARAGESGLKAARSIALLSYRQYHAYAATQADAEDITDNYRAVSYQRYQGDKLVSRKFNAYTYWHLSKAMDSHNVGREREGVARALRQIQADTLIIGIDTDVLFPPEEQLELAKHIPQCEVEIIHSDYGHDGFLLEVDQISNRITKFYNDHPSRVQLT